MNIYNNMKLMALQVSVNKQLIDFGKEVMGNNVSRDIIICNSSDIAGPYVVTGCSDRKSVTEKSTSEIKEMPLDNNYDLAGFSIDGKRVGYLNPGCSEIIHFIWEPQFIGSVTSDFAISCPGCEDIIIICRAECVNGSISLNTATIDLKICLFDNSYQDSVILTNRQNTPKMVRCVIPKELSKHLQVIPRKMLMQAKSSSHFQIKFSPRIKLSVEAPMYYDDKTCILEAPIFIEVSDEQELNIMVLAVVTNDNIVMSPSCIDFGVCTIYEKICMPVSIINCSLLPQEVGFFNMPDEIHVQSSSFGKLCPLETITVNLIFQSTRDCIYNFNLQLINGTNKIFPLKCTGRGKVPPLKLSHQVFVFRTTPPGDVYQHILYISNESCEPRLFEFGSSEQIPIHFLPKVDMLLPKQQTLIKIVYEPILSEDDIKAEASNMRVQSSPELTNNSRSEVVENVEESHTQEHKTPILDLPFSSKELLLARISLLGKLSQEEQIFNIPCFVASDLNGIAVQKHEETLFLEIHCHPCMPELLIISDDGSNVIDFGDVLIGQSITKTVTIQNISSKNIEPKGSCLDPYGNFEILNSLRTIHCQETHNLRIRFTPTCAIKYYEEYKLRNNSTTLCMTLKGRGCKPKLQISLDSNCLDFGKVMAGEILEEVLQITNGSEVNINYDTVIEYPPTASKRAFEIFDCKPLRGEIKADSKGEITIFFKSKFVGQECATCKILSFGQVLFSFQIKAETTLHSFHISGLDFQSEITGNFALNPFEKEDMPLVIKVLKSKKESTFLINCSRLSKNSKVKKNIDWSIENIQNMTELGFIIHPTKGSLDSGESEQIFVSWKPASRHKEGKSVQSVALCTIRGDVTKTYKIFFAGVN